MPVHLSKFIARPRNPYRAKLLMHTIGDIEVEDGKQVVKEFNFDTTQKVVDWVYTSFTGKNLNGAKNKYKSLLTEMLRWL